jgi:transposase InsO family protein
MDVFTRRIIGFGVAPVYIDGVSICRMFNDVTAGQRKPKHLSADHDPLFRIHRWLANLRVLEIEEIKSVPYACASHPFVERLIGTIRCETWRQHYNHVLPHSNLKDLTPIEFKTRYHANHPGAVLQS